MPRPSMRSSILLRLVSKTPANTSTVDRTAPAELSPALGPGRALIAKTQPESLNELAGKTGRAELNLSRALKTMERYGLVRFKPRSVVRLRHGWTILVSNCK